MTVCIPIDICVVRYTIPLVAERLSTVHSLPYFSSSLRAGSDAVCPKPRLTLLCVSATKHLLHDRKTGGHRRSQDGPFMSISPKHVHQQGSLPEPGADSQVRGSWRRHKGQSSSMPKASAMYSSTWQSASTAQCFGRLMDLDFSNF